MAERRTSCDGGLTSAVSVVDPTARRAVREALTALGITVTIQAEDVDTLLAAVAAQPPMVVLVGSQITGGGLHAVHRISREVPSCLTVLLAAEPTEDGMLAALGAGAVGYLPRELPASSVATALLAVLKGEVAISRVLMARVVEELQARPGRRVSTQSAPTAKLTSREWDVAALMRSGASTQQIAVRLFMSNSTVRVHVSNILHKLHVTDRDAAVRVLVGI
jgi:DNA-binding NarL/FixJ family response regulator